MLSEEQLIVSILKDIFGQPRNPNHINGKKQLEFNCKSDICKYDVDKFNLSFNTEHNIYKCWKCNDSGTVTKLVRKYGSQEDVKKLKEVLPSSYFAKSTPQKKEKLLLSSFDHITCPLPNGYVVLNSKQKTTMHKYAYRYVTKKRKLSDNDIEFFGIGYTEVGSYKNRIIIPSFNKFGEINYFTARAFLKNTKPNYLLPDEKMLNKKNIPKKHEIIFNEKNINWDLPVYLVEGVFDMFRIPNSIPLIGKTVSDLLISKIIKYNPIIIICLDEDAKNDMYTLYKNFSSLGIETYVAETSGYNDISSMYESEGKYKLMKSIQNVQKIDFFFEFKNMLKK